MSVVCCKIKGDKISIASDSIRVRGYGQEKGDRSKYAKLVQVNGMTIGATGLCYEIAMFRVFCSTRKPKRADDDSILIFLKEFLEWKKGLTGKFEILNDYILIFNKHAFLVCGFYVTEITTYEAIGAGMDFALSALYLGHGVKKAVEVACELSVYCEKPINSFVVKRGT